MMLHGLRGKVNRSLFGLKVRGLLRTPPVEIDSSLGLHVLSLLQHKDVLMYLAAIKTFAKHVPVAQVHVVNDGSLSRRDMDCLLGHVPGIVIHETEAFQRPDLPKGGCWERLVAIAELSATSYVIQLDADTLTLGPIQEVLSAVKSEQSFVIGTWDGQEFEPMRERERLAKDALSRGVRHVQVIAEANFGALNAVENMRYVRGCAGFSGFAKSSNKLDLIGQVSKEMHGCLGDVWYQWGSEQVMSNIVVANHDSAVVLPHPKYCDCTKFSIAETQFIHFIGTCRFESGRYSRLVKKVLF